MHVNVVVGYIGPVENCVCPENVQFETASALGILVQAGEGMSSQFAICKCWTDVALPCSPHSLCTTVVCRGSVRVNSCETFCRAWLPVLYSGS